MQKGSSASYRFGRYLGKHWLFILGGALALFAGASYIAPADSQTKAPQWTEEEKAVIARSAARRAEMAKAEAERQRRCSIGMPATVAEARAAMKAGDPDKGLAIMNACANAITDPDAKAAHREVLLAARAKAEKQAKVAAENAKRAEKADLARRKKLGVSIGMSADDALKSSWGRPEHINRSTNALGTHEQWVYPGFHNYLYFETES